MKHIKYKRHFWHVDDLIDMMQEDAGRLIQSCCNEYFDCIEATAKSIADDPDHKIIMLSGPSGSGKTTTANLLRHALDKLGIHSAVVSLDDFYLGLGKAPLLPNGEYDYESVHALNIPLLQQCLLDLMSKNQCVLPKFDFLTSKPSDETIPMTLAAGDLIIFEGIHALNPLILDCLPKKNVIKIFVSVETTIFGKDDMLIPPREIRLARRMVRDSIHRNADAVRTLTMWTGVMMGEEQYLFPYKDDVDYTLSTFHEFEPAVLRSVLLELLRNLPEDCPNYDLAMDLAADYALFPELDCSALPQDCLIREFIS